MKNSNQKLAGFLLGILDVRGRPRLVVRGRHSHGTERSY